MNPTERIAARDRRNADEVRRATVVSDLRIVPYDTSGLRARVFVVDVDLGRDDDQIVKNVIVQSPTGTGGKSFAANGNPVFIRRNLGGRWVCTGPADRTSRTGQVQVYDESTELAAAATTGAGFTTARRPFNFWLSSSSNVWGSAGFADLRVFDSDGVEVT